MGLCADKDKTGEGNAAERARKNFELSLYNLGCSMNKLRNKAGTGHGRPFIVDINTKDSTAVIESIGLIAETLLNRAKK